MPREREWERPDEFCGAGLWDPQVVDRVCENVEALAFHVSRRPHEAVQVLVIPKRHVETLLDVGPRDPRCCWACSRPRRKRPASSTWTSAASTCGSTACRPTSTSATCTGTWLPMNAPSEGTGLQAPACAEEAAHSLLTKFRP